MLILVRHGRTEANASGLLLGRLDPELDDVGRAQAAGVARHLAAEQGVAGRRISRIITSPLARTRATAAAISEAAGAPVTVEQRWIELDYGELDGLALSEIPSEVWQRWRGDPTFAPEGGESLSQLAHRVQAALDSVADEARENDIVIVSHVSPIKAAVAWALGAGEQITWRMYLAPASITRIAVQGHGPSLHGFNDVSHLER